MNKAAIFTEGGTSIGFGHIARCGALYEALKGEKINARIYIDGDDTLRRSILPKGAVICRWRDNAMIGRLLAEADTAVVDSYMTQKRVYSYIARHVRTVFYIDDTMRIDYPRGTVVNGSVGAEKLRYIRKAGLKYMLGAEYALLRKFFWSAGEKKIRRRIQTIMITMGWNDICGNVAPIVTLLQKRCPLIRKIVIVGKGFRDIPKLIRMKDRNTRFIFNATAAVMKRVMQASDVAISGGGQTLNELARMGVPTIAISVADNQAYNIKGWAAAGFVDYAGDGSSEHICDLVGRSLVRISGYRTRSIMSRCGSNCVDGKGALRIARRIKEGI